jgi:hypothetical protein
MGANSVLKAGREIDFCKATLVTVLLKHNNVCRIIHRRDSSEKGLSGQCHLKVDYD